MLRNCLLYLSKRDQFRDDTSERVGTLAVRAGASVQRIVATFGLLAVIWGCARLRSSAVPFAVASYITAAYWFTASTSFANPAVTLARSATDTFAGIRPADAPAFVIAQLLGAAAATGLFRWLVPTLPDVAPTVVVPRSEATHSDSRSA
jgi:glycerol uptake facilitator-like aquaporin